MNTAKRSVTIGVTGGIGSGKSTVAALLARKGAGLIDADDAARAVCAANGRAIPEIKSTFGAEFILADGSLNRDLMRQRVFNDLQSKRQLEAITHPLIALEMASRKAALHQSVIVFDIPLLVDSPRWRPQLDRVLVVDCTRDRQIQRVTSRNGWSVDTAITVLQSQVSRPKRLQAADFVIQNSNLTLEQLENEVQEFAVQLGL